MSYLAPEHAELLACSAIDPSLVEERGYRTVTEKNVLERYGFVSIQRRVPALLIPLHDVFGKQSAYQIRPNEPRLSTKGKPIKYETPSGSKIVLDCPPRCLASVRDPSGRLWITEGVRKGDAIASRGETVLAMLGVFNWRGRNELGGLTALPDWEQVALNGREVVICFDSDAADNQNVQKAARRLALWLKAKGARVRVVMPPASGAAKIGIDDHLAAGGTLDDLVALPDAPTDSRRVADELAARFEERFGAHFRYVVEDKKWAHWDGGIWQRRLTHHAEEAVMNLLREMGDDGHRFRNAYSRDQILALARHRPGLEIGAERFDQEDWLLAAANGTIDLRSGELRDSLPEDFLSKASPVVYDPQARSELWEGFVLQICAGDAELAGYLRRFAGYCLTGSTREQLFWIWTGAGSNGKTLLTTILAAAMGDLARPSPVELLVRRFQPTETQPFLIALAGARFTYVSEAGKALEGETLKTLTGSDRVTARTLYQAEPTTMVLRAKVVLIANEPPKLNATDGGIRRRVVVVPFRSRFTRKPSEPGDLPRDDDIEEKLREVLPAILAWAVQGCLDWRAQGMGTCKAVEDATSGYLVDANPLSGFAADCLEGMDELAGAELKRLYDGWVEQTKGRRIPNKRFGEAMRLLGWRHEKTRTVVVWHRDVEDVEDVSGTSHTDTSVVLHPSNTTDRPIEIELETSSTSSTDAPLPGEEATVVDVADWQRAMLGVLADGREWSRDALIAAGAVPSRYFHRTLSPLIDGGFVERAPDGYRMTRAALERLTVIDEAA